MSEKRAVVLLSGGLDSATTLAIARSRGFEIYALTVHYGQRHAVEVERAAEVARSLGAAEHRVVPVDLTFAGGSALTDPAIPVPDAPAGEEIGSSIPPTYVPARNTVLLALGLAWAETLGARDLFVGVNAVDFSGYPDCRLEFLEAFENLARLATRAGAEGTEFRVHAPLLRWKKAEIIRAATDLGVDLSRTISCYAPGPDGRACGRCEACALRARGFRDAGIDDPAAAG
jgi:7-cyano-7-deazaguanine synthase